jgi:PAT family beta-lactamase induction signal transducer AmpG
MEEQNKRSPRFWVPSLYLAQGLPYFAVALVANQMFKSLGMANDTLNHWSALIGMACGLKPL